MDRPVVALVRGRALGGGCGLASACDIVLAHQDAIFGYPEVRLGFVPALVMAPLQAQGGRGGRLSSWYCGDTGSAPPRRSRSDSPPGSFPETTSTAATDEYLRELAGRPATAVALAKRLFHGLDGVSFEDAIARGAEINAMARLTEDPAGTGVKRFMDRKARFSTDRCFAHRGRRREGEDRFLAWKVRLS